METWKEYLEETQKCLESFDEFRKHVKTKQKSEWESMQEIVENVKGTDISELLTEKEKLSQIETNRPSYQWMQHNTKYDNRNFTTEFKFTLDELEQNKFLKTETCIKNDKDEYFENLLNIAGDCIVKAGKDSKKFKPTKDTPTYIANNNKYEFVLSLEPKEWRFTIYANTQKDVLECIKDIFSVWDDKLDIGLSSFDDKIVEWISRKFSNFNNKII